ncbi:hypothetical protein [Microbispora sp. NPDC049125]|uniref:hypothetical protein n=1 Tax=Microbispora sp. NPDC049125 TaxID=3154929 RepID=UPI0034657616
MIAWTCDCRSSVYELCHAGGVAFLRRTRRSDAGTTEHETHRWCLHQGDEVWAALLTGTAR